MSGKYLPSATRTTSPTRILAFSVDTTSGRKDEDDSNVNRVFHSVYARYSVYRRAGWNNNQERRFRSIPEWWDYVYGLCDTKSLLTLVSPACIDDLTLLRVWEELDKKTILIQWKGTPRPDPNNPGKVTKDKYYGRLTTGNPPDILYGMTSGGPMKAVSIRNYVMSSLEQQAKTLSIAWNPARRNNPRTLIRGWTANDASDVCMHMFRKLADWWRSGDCGPWRDTTPQLSLSLFKRHYLSHRALIHEDPFAADLERRAMHGARQSVWFYGDVGKHPGDRRGQQPPPDPSRYPAEPGPCYRLDVRSQYPFLMHQFAYPAVLMGVWEKTTPDHLNAVLKVWGAIATVLIKTERAEYPVRGKHYTYYPTGRFWTTLAGPELTRALSEGCVERVGAVARYEMKPVFRDFAAWMWERRCEYQLRGDVVGEAMVKLIANSFAGKLAQKPGRFVPRPDSTPRKRWGITTIKNADTDGVTIERGVGGLREVWDTSIVQRAVSPAAFAYLTAYGRLMMRDLRELLRPRDVFAQHTDCIWVNDAGYERLVQLDKIQPLQFGGLKPSESITYSRFLGPAHRYHDGKWTAGGIAEGFEVMRHCTLRTRVQLNPHRKTMPSARGFVRDIVIERNLSKIKRPNKVALDGWAEPFYHYISDVGPQPEFNDVDAG